MSRDSCAWVVMIKPWMIEARMTATGIRAPSGCVAPGRPRRHLRQGGYRIPSFKIARRGGVVCRFSDIVPPPFGAIRGSSRRTNREVLMAGAGAGLRKIVVKPAATLVAGAMLASFAAV